MTASSGAPGVFDGIQVLELTSALAGPTVTRLMAELGADVVKIEMPPAGEMARALPAIKNGRSGYFVQQNRGKQSLCVDMKTPKGLQIVLDLAAKADVVVQNLAPGVLDRLGAGWSVLSELNPRLILCSISAFGEGGPLSPLPGYDYIAQAYAGTLHMVGEPDRPPAMAGFGAGDVMTGAHALAGVSAALYHRERTGIGQHVQAALVDCHLTTHELNIQVWSLTGQDPIRAGSVHPVVGGCGVYAAGSGHVVIAVGSDAQWRASCTAMQAPELVTDHRFATAQARCDNRDQTNAVFEAWLAKVGDRDQAVSLLEAHGVPVAPVLSVSEAATHPHNVATGAIRDVDDERLGRVTIPGVPIKLSSFPEQRELAARSLGADNRQLLTDRLGWTDEQVGEALADGVLHENPAT